MTDDSGPEDGGSNIKVLETKATKEISDLQASVGIMKRAMTAQMEYRTLVAKLQRCSYLAYIDEGFTEAQALQLAMSFK